MALAFNQTTSPYQGLVQFFEKEIGVNYGDISGNSELLGEFTSRCNLALDDFTELAINSAGLWEWDDSSTYESNGTTERGWPILKADIISGQRDYKFVDDSAGNFILDIHRVAILPSATATLYEEIPLIDELNSGNNDILTESSTTGTPGAYGKLSNGIFLDTKPGYNATLGLKLYVNRTASYFQSSDTIKKVGIPAIFHKYLFLKPAYEYASIKGLSNLRELEKKVIDLEGSERLGITGKIQEYFSQRNRDISPIMSMEKLDYE